MTEQSTEKQIEVRKKIDSPTQQKARELASRIRYMIVGGANLSDAEVFALAQFAAATDLNPFAGECYYLPGIGPSAGIAGWRKKAQEQLDFESQQAGTTGSHFWVEYRDAEPGEALFDPNKGDIAIVATLHEWDSNSKWRHAIFETAHQLKEFAVADPMAEAKAMVGAEPVWTGVAVVYKSESFAKEGKTEKFDRIERCQKRAEKLAIRKRFPRINLPEPRGAQVDFVDAEFAEQEQRPKRSEKQNLQELGYGPESGKAPEPGQEPEPEADLDPSTLSTTHEPPADVKAAMMRRFGNNILGEMKVEELIALAEDQTKAEGLRREARLLVDWMTD